MRFYMFGSSLGQVLTEARTICFQYVSRPMSIYAHTCYVLLGCYMFVFFVIASPFLVFSTGYLMFMFFCFWFVFVVGVLYNLSLLALVSLVCFV